MDNLIEYLPEILKEIKEFKALCDAEDPEVQALWSIISDITNDQFVSDSTENGVKRWESIMKISPKGTDSLDVRKFRILARLGESNVATSTVLENQLKTLCGLGGYTILLTHGTYTLKVRVALAVKGQFDEVKNFLDRTVPANIIVDLTLLYNPHSLLAGFTNAQLAAYTHEQLKSEVIH